MKFWADGFNYRRASWKRKENLGIYSCVIKIRFKIHYFQLVHASTVHHSQIFFFALFAALRERDAGGLDQLTLQTRSVTENRQPY